MSTIRTTCVGLALVLAPMPPCDCRADHLAQLQGQAMSEGISPAAHWGWRADQYALWGSHTNRLIPVYTFGTRDQGTGVDVREYLEERSAYRSERELIRLYGQIPAKTLNNSSEYMDQTNVFDMQFAGLQAGKKHLFLVVFDGMDWDTTRAAAIYNSGRVAYENGRGTGTHFQEYSADNTSQFAYMVTSPHNEGTKVDVNWQLVVSQGNLLGGFDAERGGPNPWTSGNDARYISAPRDSPDRHAFTDSASAATSMTTGAKTYNGSVLVDTEGRRLISIAHRAQSRGFAVGTVTNVPISHATPAAAYAHNASRHDYQDLARDMLGLLSISHPVRPLPGLDVAIGGGFGVERELDDGQGLNFVPGNAYLTEAVLREADVESGGRYRVAIRTAGVDGHKMLADSAQQAAADGDRLLGFYGVGGARGHLPFATADRDYQTVPGRTKKAELYESADLNENPTLAEMTSAALTVLSTDPDGLWLLVEAGDVDWANHDNNLDNSIGAVNSGDEAIKVITSWVEKNSDWNESLMIVTADHGHYLVLTQPELLVEPPASPAGPTQRADQIHIRVPKHD
jgi:alkaline phosphatase